MSDPKYFHIFNSGIEKRIVFTDKKDLDRFADTLEYYRFKNNPARFSFRKRGRYKSDAELIPLIKVIGYLMMPDHFHLLLSQNGDESASKYISLVTNSYTKYFNARHKRQGPLFAGTFKSKAVSPDELLKLSAFIHMEPVRRGIVLDVNRFPFSSFQEYMGSGDGFCDKEIIMRNFAQSADYRNYLIQGGYNDSSITPLLLE